MKICRVIVLVGLLAGLLSQGAAVHPQQTGVSDARFARLARGANLPFWFWYAPQDVEGFFSERDLATIRRLGFTYVRVPIDMEWLFDDADADRLDDTHLAVLDRCLDRILAADLAVMIDLHSTSLADSDASVYSGALERDEAFVETFITFWRALAGHLSERDPEMVFFEPMNEPVFEDDPARWPPMQASILSAIREVAPEHTLVATSALWSGIDTFVELEPLTDPNIVYNFHFYEPFLFTHQGADWTWWVVAGLRGVPYPSSPETVATLAGAEDNAEVRDQLRWYGEERWDAAKIDERIALAAAWGAQHGVRLICDEFGALDQYSAAEDRVRWMYDVRTTLETYGIGWSIWDYDGEFGVARRENGKTFVDLEAARALGLNTAG